MSVPGVGPITALAFTAAIEDPHRFGSNRDVGAYLGLTPKRYQSGERDISLSISRQGDEMVRHYLYEAANCLLTTVTGAMSSSVSKWDWRHVLRIIRSQLGLDLGLDFQLKPEMQRQAKTASRSRTGFHLLDIFVGDLLLSRPDRFHGELVEHAEDFCCYAVRRPSQRSQALSRERRRSLQREGGKSQLQGSETRCRPSTAATPFDPTVLKAEYRRLWPRGRCRQGRPKMPSTRYSSDERAGG